MICTLMKTENDMTYSRTWLDRGNNLQSTPTSEIWLPFLPSFFIAQNATVETGRPFIVYPALSPRSNPESIQILKEGPLLLFEYSQGWI